MTDPDITSVIAEQHEGTKQAMSGLLSHRGAERADLFRKLRVTMALHETAELLTVHPESARQLGGHDRPILDLVAEESGARQLIGRLESLDIDSDTFADGFEELATSVLRHAESEEADEWPVLREITDRAAIERMVVVMSAVPGLAEDPHGLAQEATFSQMLGWAERVLAREVEVEPDNTANDPASADSQEPSTAEPADATAAVSDSGEQDAEPTAKTTSHDVRSVTTTTDRVDVPTTFERLGVDGESRTLEFDPPETRSSDA